MAARRKNRQNAPRPSFTPLLLRIRSYIAAQDRVTLIGVTVVILFALYAFLRDTPKPPQPPATTTPQRTTPPKQTTPKPQDTTPLPDPDPEPEPEPDTDPEPEPEPEPDPEPDTDPEPTPEPSATAEPEPGTDADTPTDDTPDDDTPPAPQPKKTAPPLLIEENNPYASALSLQGNKTEMIKQWKGFLDRLMEHADVEPFAAATEYRIRESIPQLFSGKNLMYASYRSSATLMQAMELCYTIRHVGAKNFSYFIRPNTKGEDDGVGRAFVVWLLTDRARPLHYFLQAFKLNSGQPAQLHYALKTFFEIWKRSSERDRTKYLNLAIACSIVQESIAKAPGPLRDDTAKPLSMPELYEYFVELDSHSKLLADIKKTPVSDLLYVVDVRLPRSEFEWVHKNLHYKRAEWGKTYESVKYLMDRATDGFDPYNDYTFEEILEKGGICHDRALYASNTAKCVGIPATYVSGDGDRGPHAWVGLLTADKTWTGAGSYGYSTGRFRNPCSGRFQHESMHLLRDKKVADDKLETAANLLLLSEYAGELGMDNEALMSAQYVTYNYPLLTAGWLSRIEVMKTQNEREPLSLNLWKRLHVELTRAGEKNSELLDLAQELQKDVILSNARDATKKSMLRQSTRKIEKAVEDTGRVDLLEESIARQAEIYAQAKDYHGLATFYRQYYKKYAERGDVFGNLLRQHAGFLGETEDKKWWIALARDADKLFSKNAYDGDYFKVKKSASVMNLIADLYEQGGDTRRADKIRKDAASILEKSTPKKKNR